MNKLIKKILMIISFLVIIGVIISIFLKQRREVIFTLNGDSFIAIFSNETFNDPLFTAKNGYGKDLSKYITISDNIDYSKSEEYTITYTLDYLDYHNSLIRTIVIKEDGDYTFILNGGVINYYLLGEEYEEKGAYVIDNKTNERIDISFVISNVDTNKVGEYQVKYMYKNKEEIRKVIVSN